MITIVDYGVGNVGALQNMFDYLGIDAECSSEPEAIASSERLLLPGVGAFDRAVRALDERGIRDALNEAVCRRGVPVLGVCLGMQLLARRSEEGVERGLGWIDADVVRIVSPGPEYKVPHIGWADVHAPRISVIFPETEGGERFYFDHGYVMHCDHPEDVAATFDFGSPLTCAVSHGNVSGVQFHPEKSHRFGMRLLSGWARSGAR